MFLHTNLNSHLLVFLSSLSSRECMFLFKTEGAVKGINSTLGPHRCGRRAEILFFYFEKKRKEQGCDVFP